nr:MAG TPA: hypothetical protein [Caudoviricetes sp.]
MGRGFFLDFVHLNRSFFVTVQKRKSRRFLHGPVLLFIEFCICLNKFFPSFNHIIIEIFTPIMSIHIQVIGTHQLPLIKSKYISLIISFSIAFAIYFANRCIVNTNQHTRPDNTSNSANTNFPRFFHNKYLLSNMSLPHKGARYFRVFSSNFRGLTVPSRAHSVRHSLQGSSVSSTLKLLHFGQ